MLQNFHQFFYHEKLRSRLEVVAKLFPSQRFVEHERKERTSIFASTPPTASSKVITNTRTHSTELSCERGEGGSDGSGGGKTFSPKTFFSYFSIAMWLLLLLLANFHGANPAKKAFA